MASAPTLPLSAGVVDTVAHAHASLFAFLAGSTTAAGRRARSTRFRCSEARSIRTPRTIAGPAFGAIGLAAGQVTNAGCVGAAVEPARDSSPARSRDLNLLLVRQPRDGVLFDPALLLVAALVRPLEAEHRAHAMDDRERCGADQDNGVFRDREASASACVERTHHDIHPGDRPLAGAVDGLSVSVKVLLSLHQHRGASGDGGEARSDSDVAHRVDRLAAHSVGHESTVKKFAARVLRNRAEQATAPVRAKGVN